MPDSDASSAAGPVGEVGATPTSAAAAGPVGEVGAAPAAAARPVGEVGAAPTSAAAAGPPEVGATRTVVVEVMLKAEILDPQGQAVAAALPRLGVTGVPAVRQGKRFELTVEGEPDREAIERVAATLLANPVIEDFVVRWAD